MWIGFQGGRANRVQKNPAGCHRPISPFVPRAQTKKRTRSPVYGVKVPNKSLVQGYAGHCLTPGCPKNERTHTKTRSCDTSPQSLVKPAYEFKGGYPTPETVQQAY